MSALSWWADEVSNNDSRFTSEPDPAAQPRQNDVVQPLSFLVEVEARQVLSDVQLRADPLRVAYGWKRRFLTDASRTKEVMELYEQLGYEVCADPVHVEDLVGACADCQLVILQNFKTIYTRRKRNG